MYRMKHAFTTMLNLLKGFNVKWYWIIWFRSCFFFYLKLKLLVLVKKMILNRIKSVPKFTQDLKKYDVKAESSELLKVKLFN